MARKGENVRRNNFNISPNTHLFDTIISALERSIYVDAFQVFYHQNQTSIGEDTIILAIII
jgi:predicted Zn-dependent protease